MPMKGYRLVLIDAVLEKADTPALL